MALGLRTYRLFAALLALGLLGLSAAPLVEHLCDRAKDVVAAHDCCGDHCPGHPAAPTEREGEPMGAERLCCIQTPAGPVSEAPALPAPPAHDLALLAVAELSSGETREASARVPAPAPPRPLRVHALYAVWLI